MELIILLAIIVWVAYEIFKVVFFLEAIRGIPDYMVENTDVTGGSEVKVTTTTKVIAEKPKQVKTKTKVVKKAKPLNSHKYKMARFEEEAFWMNVFDDEEGC